MRGVGAIPAVLPRQKRREPRGVDHPAGAPDLGLVVVTKGDDLFAAGRQFDLLNGRRPEHFCA
jgi:hypothetical protein